MPYANDQLKRILGIRQTQNLVRKLAIDNSDRNSAQGFDIFECALYYVCEYYCQHQSIALHRLMNNNVITYIASNAWVGLTSLTDL